MYSPDAIARPRDEQVALARALTGIQAALDVLPRESTWRPCFLDCSSVLRAGILRARRAELEGDC